MSNSKKTTIVVHNDRFHADDVFTVAALDLAFDGNIEVTRTRDAEIIAQADIVADVGGVYDSATQRFDHHQTEGAGKRENGIPYASFGLVWKEYGVNITGSPEVQAIVDRRLVSPIDAEDNGVTFFETTQDDVFPFTISSVVGVYNPTSSEDGLMYDTQFFKAVEVAKAVLLREIIWAKDYVETEKFLDELYENTEDKRVLVMDELHGSFKCIVQKYPETLFVVSPSKLGDVWRINAVQEGSYVNRKDLPQAWAGLRDDELEKVSGVKGAVFCHRNLFMGSAKTKEAALLMVSEALK